MIPHLSEKGYILIAVMKPLPSELRETVIKAYKLGNTSIRKLAIRFDVSKYEC